ncbi:Glycosyltransferase involved in cell wall biogenesis [hydrothermal vent metagenome]|uniref:Glycosyltransferase involved in cell wall biogenesis n=1 Tax=hydrothermal vent metagenome TaxID=652676 RepID=A0A3B0YDN8_9ZZZZ
MVPRNYNLSIVLPCYNEAQNLEPLLVKLKQAQPDAELLLIDDCSTDDSRKIAEQQAIKVIPHLQNMGNGACIKTGIRNAQGEVVIFMDADGQHDPDDINLLLDKLDEGYDMVVGARNQASHASFLRRVGNNFYNKVASVITRYKIEDLTSGFRAVRAKIFKEFIHLYPNGFSYPTTCTMAFIRSGYQIAYIPIVAGTRGGKSHLNPIRDGLKFLIIIFKVGTLYSPLKLFLPISLLHLLTGMSYYTYTFFTAGRFTNMSALFIIAAMLIFLIGLVSEQITALLYHKKE